MTGTISVTHTGVGELLPTRESPLGGAPLHGKGAAVTCPDVGTHVDSRAADHGATDARFNGVLPAQRTADNRSGLVAQGPAGRRPTSPGARALLIDPDTATSDSLARSLTAAGFWAVISAPDPDSVPDIEPTAGDLAVVTLRATVGAEATIRQLHAAGWRRITALSLTGDVADIAAAIEAGATSLLVAGHTSPVGDVPTSIYDLSPREVEVLRMVADGRSNRWIGEHLELSALTVKSHLARIGRKLGTGDRAHMVMLALRAGMIS